MLDVLLAVWELACDLYQKGEWMMLSVLCVSLCLAVRELASIVVCSVGAVMKLLGLVD